MEHVINAQGKKIGRVATEAAHLLLGKDTPQFTKHEVADVIVRVTNVGQLDISQKKALSKIYTRYSGYPGGLKKTTLSELSAKKGIGEAIRKAIYGMLPGNKLRAKRMKQLIIEQ